VETQLGLLATIHVEYVVATIQPVKVVMVLFFLERHMTPVVYVAETIQPVQVVTACCFQVSIMIGVEYAMEPIPLALVVMA
jgi:hypothetical protein